MIFNTIKLCASIYVCSSWYYIGNLFTNAISKKYNSRNIKWYSKHDNNNNDGND